MIVSRTSLQKMVTAACQPQCRERVLPKGVANRNCSAWRNCVFLSLTKASEYLKILGSKRPGALPHSSGLWLCRLQGPEYVREFLFLLSCCPFADSWEMKGQFFLFLLPQVHEQKRPRLSEVQISPKADKHF